MRCVSKPVGRASANISPAMTSTRSLPPCRAMASRAMRSTGGFSNTAARSSRYRAARSTRRSRSRRRYRAMPFARRDRPLPPAPAPGIRHDIHRRGKLRGKLWTLHRFCPLLRIVASPRRREAGLQHLHHIQRLWPIAERCIVRAEIPGRAADQMFPRPEGEMKHAPRHRREPQGGAQGHQHIRGPGLKIELHADGSQRGRMIRQPGVEIQMSDRGREEIDGIDPIAHPVKGRGICCWLGEELREVHGK